MENLDFLIVIVYILSAHAAVTQLVAYQLPKLEVAGSSPVSRSIEDEVSDIRTGSHPFIFGV